MLRKQFFWKKAVCWNSAKLPKKLRNFSTGFLNCFFMFKIELLVCTTIKRDNLDFYCSPDQSCCNAKVQFHAAERLLLKLHRFPALF